MKTKPLPDNPTLAIIIPVLNEARRLPVLLDLLAKQTRRPDAIIVADGRSTDATREIALMAGASVVDGGLPAIGRNAGAAAASTDLLLFLDADVEPPPEWIEQAVAEFVDRALTVATAQVGPLERTPVNVLACEVVNLYLQLMQYFSPHAAGSCILIRRDVHKVIGGFNTTVILAEDHDYVQKAATKGKFRVLRHAPAMPTSMRRLEKEGLVTLAFKYLYSEIHVLTGRPIKEIPFDYEFAAFDKGGRPSVFQEPESFRERLGESIVKPLEKLSSSVVDRIRRLGENKMSPEAINRLLKEFTPNEITELQQYVSRRAEAALKATPVILRRIHKAGKRILHKITADF
jgi:glycosyltransferase involved in cell wall biosynthesis